MKLSPQAQSTLILVAAALLILWYLKGQAATAADTVVEAFNPADQNNLANRGFNSLYQMLTGSDGSLGTDLADYFNPVEL